MRAITVTQPRATLIAIGVKKIETRSRATHYHGPLAIHAAAGLGPVGGILGAKELCWSEPFRAALKRGGAWPEETDLPPLPLGAIVAVCRLVGCMEIDGAPTGFAVHTATDSRVWWRTREEIAFGDYTPGRYAWLLSDVRALPEPVPCRGALGLWTPDAATLAAIERQLEKG